MISVLRWTSIDPVEVLLDVSTPVVEEVYHNQHIVQDEALQIQVLLKMAEVMDQRRSEDV